jgi:hypothetical protein
MTMYGGGEPLRVVEAGEPVTVEVVPGVLSAESVRPQAVISGMLSPLKARLSEAEFSMR